MHVEEINPWDSPGIPSWTTADAVELPAKVYVQVIANHMEDLAAHHLTLRVAQLLQRSKGYYINKGITVMELTSINLELRSREAKVWLSSGSWAGVAGAVYLSKARANPPLLLPISAGFSTGAAPSAGFSVSPLISLMATGSRRWPVKEPIWRPDLLSFCRSDMVFI